MTDDGQGAMTTDSPHLTLAELTASDGSGHLSAAAASHRQTCAACRARGRNAVPDGVRLLVSGWTPPPDLIQAVFAAIDAQPASASRNWRARRPAGRRIVLTAAAAAVVAVAAGVGVATALRLAGQPAPHPRPDSTAATAAGLTATGCSRLDVAGGTLQRVSGTDLVLTVAGGRQVTVTTSASTSIFREIIGTPADVTDGTQVLVSGTATGGTIAASRVGILPVIPDVPTPPGDGLQLGIAQGRVAAASGGGFTVVERDGTRVPVTMSSSTPVITTVASSLSQLQPDKITSAVGGQGPGGTLAATAVEQDDLPAGTLKAPLVPPSPVHLPLPGPRLSLPAPSVLPSQGAGPGAGIRSLGCAPTALTSTDLLALGG